jgi:hypothetical protein
LSLSLPTKCRDSAPELSKTAIFNILYKLYPATRDILIKFVLELV